MTEIREAFLDELDTWECNGVNIGAAVRKQFVPEHLPEVEVEDGIDENGRTIIFTKPYCPDCDSISYMKTEIFCHRCGRRLRK